jgi:O-antigen/teichoic acid export membrane protein
LTSPTSDGSTARAGQSGLLTRLYAGSARNLVGTVFNQGSTFALNFVAAHALGLLRFGEFMIVQATLTTAGNLGQFATGYTATKYIAEFRTRDRARASRILGLCAAASAVTGCFAAVALFLAAPSLAARAFNAPSLSTPLMIAAPAVMFIIMNGFRTGALGGLESYGALARVGVISGIAYLVLGSAGAFLAGVNGALAGVAASAIVQWIVLGRLLTEESARRGLATVYDHPWRERDLLIRFALPASLSGFVTLPALWLASTILVSQPGGLEQMALFGAANTYRVAVLFLPNTVNVVGMSLLNNQRGAGDDAYRRVFWWNLATTAGLAVAAAAAVTITGKWLLEAFGRSFENGYGTLLVLMVAAIIEAITMAFYQVVQSQAKLWLSLFVVAMPRDSLIVVAAYLLTPSLGALGLAAAYAIGWTVALCTTSALALRLGIHAGGAADGPALIVEPIDAGRV